MQPLKLISLGPHCSRSQFTAENCCWANLIGAYEHEELQTHTIMYWL